MRYSKTENTLVLCCSPLFIMLGYLGISFICFYFVLVNHFIKKSAKYYDVIIIVMVASRFIEHLWNVILLIKLQRDPSPPVPALQRKQTNFVASRPRSVLSQLSSRTVSQSVSQSWVHILSHSRCYDEKCTMQFTWQERTVSAPHYQAVPVNKPQQQGKTVFKKIKSLAACNT